ncbi:MAG TPA: hypothetical protein VNZ56_09965 [Verrucomicrobiae bacterium]|jgi:hypothetical protein|nr:hypothetical protein [Verrucomicrobiae bacterium]
MKRYALGSIPVVVAALALSVGWMARATPEVRAARPQTAAAMPDLTGVWSPPRTPKGFLPYNFSPEAPPPMQAWAVKRCELVGCGTGQLGRANDDGMDPFLASCAPYGLPRLMNHVGPFEILQNKSRVLILFETGNAIEQIWTDGRGHPEDLDPSWMGHSIGHWEGATLVVDIVGLTDKSWLDTAGHPHSDALHVTERIRRVDHDTLENTLTFDDPKTYTRTWSSTIIYKLHPDWSLKEDIACEDKILMDLKAKKDKVYPYQPYPMNFPTEAIPLPDVANAK